MWTIEAEKLRTRRLVTPIAMRTRIMRRQQNISSLSLSPCLLVSPAPPLHFFLGSNNDAPFPKDKRLIPRLRQPGPDLGVDPQPVDDNLDVVLDLPVQFQI